jgi:hypothetical protein
MRKIIRRIIRKKGGEKMEKKISIVVAASGEVKDVAISPGATVREVMQEADLQGYQLSRKGGVALEPDTDLFESANSTEKFYATPLDVSVGDGGLASSPLLLCLRLELSRTNI